MLQGVEFPESLKAAGLDLKLNGVGFRQKTVAFFKADVYVAALYLKQRARSEQLILQSSDPKRLDIVFLRDVTAQQIIDSWNEGFEGNCSRPCAEMQDRLKLLNAAMVDVPKGQRVTFVFFPDHFELTTPNHGSKIFKGKDFGDMVIATFIGKSPPSEQVKNGMLGLNRSIASVSE